ncbi:unnamed protein product [Rotaria socialis]|uniref:G-patch domain-containing protein n=1 Tax=Rotaria socialis TaxID=392032 RepID=A0A818PK43_9BILA|nr:unnamed protein product [Rotaria socialis]
MGYEQCRGLGKTLQGRVEPIQAIQRQGKGSIGRYGNEDPNRVIATEELEIHELTENSKKHVGPTALQWRIQQREKTPQQEYVCKTLNNVLKDQTTKFHNKNSSKQMQEKIIDMTGREQRILQNYDSIRTKQYDNEQVFSLNELTHNLDLVIESCEESMVRSHRRRKFDEDTTVALEHDSSYLQKIMSDEENSMNRINILLNMINQCEQYVNQVQNISNLFFLQQIRSCFTLLFKRTSSSWNIYDEDQELIDLFWKWKQILDDETIDVTIDNSIQSTEIMNPYHRLVWDVWMPFLRKSIREWNPREPDDLIDFIERWIPYLPRRIIDNILDQLIFPMLHREVDSWNPLTDSKPIHSWLHPWLPLMRYRLKPLYQPIRTKLAHALQNWQLSDSSAKAVLLPWQKVFKQETWNAFMNKHVVPKLVSTMQQFIIDPRQQILDPWHWFIAWYDMVPLPSMILILEKCFFSKMATSMFICFVFLTKKHSQNDLLLYSANMQKIFRALNIWLSTNVNYQEIQRWYIGWRSLIPQAIINHTTVRKILTEGLMMIDRKISGTLNIQQTFPSPSQSSSNSISSFKDLLEKRAMQYNVLFAPLRNRTFQEKQIYQFGDHYIYLDDNVRFCFETNQYVPISLMGLIKKTIDL